MDKFLSDKINGYGAILRFITPVLIGALGFLIIRCIGDIDKKITVMDLHFTNHVNHHQDLEIGYERRLSILETKIE